MNASFEYMNAMAREYERQGASLRRELSAVRARDAAEAKARRPEKARTRSFPVLHLPRLAFRRA